MSEPTGTVEEPDWPTHCPDCGTQLQSEAVDLVQGEGDQELTAVVAHDVCPNPDCPGTTSDLSPIGEGEAERWLKQPGTEGGANGGA